MRQNFRAVIDQFANCHYAILQFEVLLPVAGLLGSGGFVFVHSGMLQTGSCLLFPYRRYVSLRDG